MLLVVVDVVVAVALALLWLAEVDLSGSTPRVVAETALSLAATLPFALRRYAPRAVFGVLAACFAVALVADVAATGIGVALAAYTVLVEESRRAGLVAVAVGYGLISMAYLVLPDTALSTFFLDAITFALLIGVAELVRTRRTLSHIYAERAAQLERDRVALAQQAVAEERLRIARELHDVVAHSISLIAVQSSVGLDRIRHDPVAAEHALDTIETNSRSALAEMQRMLGMLRPESGTGVELHPTAESRQVVATRGGGGGGRCSHHDSGGRSATFGRSPGPRPLRIPDRAGGVDERHQARTGRTCPGVCEVAG